MEAKKIIITGGANRIGAAIAKKLSGPNVEIVIHYNRSKKNAERLKNELSNFKLDTNNNMIKLDVQGSEIDILKGLGSNIDLFEIILLETSVKEYNKGSPLFIDVINFMNEKNFSFYDIYDLKRLGMNKSFLVQFDAVFIRKNSSLLNFDVF